MSFIGDYSLHVEKEQRLLFLRYLSHILSLNVVHNCFKTSDMFEHKEHQPKFLRSNVVYRLTCSCDSVDIAQTRRNLRAHLNDHNPAAHSNQQSDVAKLLLDFNKPEILFSAYNFKNQLIKETLPIH